MVQVCSSGCLPSCLSSFFIAWWNDPYLLPWSLLWARVTFHFDHFTEFVKFFKGTMEVFSVPCFLACQLYRWHHMARCTSCDMQIVRDNHRVFHLLSSGWSDFLLIFTIYYLSMSKLQHSHIDDNHSPYNGWKRLGRDSLLTPNRFSHNLRDRSVYRIGLSCHILSYSLVKLSWVAWLTP
jgi:hypothetical protein